MSQNFGVFFWAYYFVHQTKTPHMVRESEQFRIAKKITPQDQGSIAHSQMGMVCLKETARIMENAENANTAMTLNVLDKKKQL
jgi:hypothetical protein